MSELDSGLRGWAKMEADLSSIVVSTPQILFLSAVLSFYFFVVVFLRDILPSKDYSDDTLELLVL